MTGRNGTELSVGSLERALDILELFQCRGTALRLTEVARATGVPKSTAHRLLAVLCARGAVERIDCRYQVGMKLFEIGNAHQFGAPQSLREVAASHLARLHSATRLTVHLAVLDDHDVVYVDKISGSGSPPTPTSVGARAPARCTALGKAIIAFSSASTRQHVLGEPGRGESIRYAVDAGRLSAELDIARRQRIAFDREEFRPGLSCVAAPVLDRSGRPVAAVSVSGPANTAGSPDQAARVAHVAHRIESSLQAAHLS